MKMDISVRVREGDKERVNLCAQVFSDIMSVRCMMIY